ncbi:MAG: (d)CMP kinase [Clostridia bacterium]|nr:(d)CMP kinase [Clostridium sp.]HJJ13019.1 (d)CMP kinase [Clostridiaceae bacterium]
MDGEKMSYIVAIDGPAGAGKGTITKLVAKELGLVSIDTGMLYRCHALAILRNNINLSNEKEIEDMLDKIKIELRNENNKQTVFLNGEDVTSEIRMPEISKVVSKTSSILGVREKITNLERKVGYEWLKQGKNIIMEGRDITTVVFPEADVKIYLDATPIERAKRRCRQNKRNGINQSFNEVLQSIMERDKNDMNKKVGALKKAPDAIYVDSSKSNVNKIKQKIIKIIRQKTKENKNENIKKDIKSNS